MPIKKPLAERLWSAVESAGECLVWTGYSFVPNKNRPARRIGMIYGTERAELVHRVAWELFYGPILDGFAIRQMCGNTLCVRSDHLVCGRFRGLRRRYTEADRRAIRRYYMQHGGTQRELAAHFHCSAATIARVVRDLR